MTQSFTRHVRMMLLVLATVCTTRLGATAVASNLVTTAGTVSTLTSSPGENTGGVPGVGPTVNLTANNVLCYGAKTGSIVNTVSGDGPFTFAWSNGKTTQNLNNIGAGTYTVTVTDTEGDETVQTTSVSQGAPIVAYINCIHVCPGSCTGTANVTILSGGTAPYSYEWSNGATSSAISGLCPGVYWVTITDANGCKKIVGASVSTTTGGVVLSGVATNSGCGTPCTGTINQTVSGAAGPYVFIWNDGATTEDRSGLCPGTYSVTVTAANGCVDDATYTVTGANGFTVTAVVTNPLCPPVGGSEDGVVVAVVVGGAAPYTYAWSNGGNTSSIDSLGAGNYCVTVTDANGCTASDCDNVVVPNGVDLDGVIVNTGCGTPCSGSITQTVNGAAGPYTFIWSNGATSQNLSGLCAGTYSSTVTAANGCTGSADYTVQGAGGIQLVVDTICSGQPCASSATVTVVGGAGPYNYAWSNGDNTATADSLCGNVVYTVTVTDANGCIAIATAVCPELVPCPSFAITVTGTNASCANPCSGSASVSVNGATSIAGYTFTWSNGATVTSLSSLCAGTYCVTVVDALGCTATGCYTVNAVSGFTLNATATNPTCFGYMNGSASVAVLGGTAPFTYNWSNGGANANITNIGAGTYSVTVTDANNCSAADTVVVVAPPKIVAYIYCMNTCPDQCNGTANLTVTGGTPPYTYAWSTGATTEDLTGLCAGVYWVTITDANGCIKIVGAAVLELPEVVVTGTVTNAVCVGNCSGAIAINATGGGSSTYTYIWSNGSTVKNQTGLCTGTYCVTVTSAHGCIDTACFTVNSAPPVTVDVIGTSPICAPGSGSAVAVATSGTSPYTYAWSNGSTGASVSGLSAGVICVTVTDANGCTASACDTISIPTPLVVNVIANDIDCYGAATGSVSVVVSGGTGAYTYMWTGGATTASADGLAAGTYCVTVYDANQCSATDCDSIEQPEMLMVDVTPTNVTCYGLCNGTIAVSVTGGTGAYSYTWNDSTLAGGSLSELCAGTYCVTVTDANGCTAVECVTITAPPAIVISSNPDDVTCYNGFDGSITVVATGGTGTLTIEWADGSTDWTAMDLAAGIYCFTVTDANGCTATGCDTVNEPEPLLAYSECPVMILCPGDCTGIIDVTVTGGTPPYSYEWSDGATTEDRAALCAGFYGVTITDAAGCTFDLLHVLENPDSIVVTVTSDDVNCYSECTGAIIVNATGGTGSISIEWANGDSAFAATGLCAGTYCFTVTDANGCTYSDCVTINQPSQLVATAIGTNLTCYGVENGTITVIVSGGTYPYTYAWANGNADSTGTGLGAGTYQITITDANGCTIVVEETITEPAPLVLVVDGDDILCAGQITGSVSVTVTGGTAPYSYAWTGGNTTSSASGLAAGTYCVTVTDANGCTATDCVTINAPAPLVVNVVPVDVTCYGTATGSVSVVVSGGTGAYTYLWTGGGTTASANGLVAGVYCVTVTDANGCTASDCDTINQPAPVTVVIDVTNPVCAPGFGSASVTITGGVGDISYEWSNGATTATAGGLVAGSICVTVTDDNGCTASDCDVIVVPTPLEVDVIGTSPICAPGTGSAVAVANGGTGAYSYAWSNGGTTASATGLNAGIICVTVTDANGCTASACDTINVPAPITVTVVAEDVDCYGGANGSVTAIVSGGTAPYTYIWTGGGTTTSASSLVAGVYCVTVTDANQCSATDCDTVNQPAPVTVEVDATNPLCVPGTGSATVSVNGGAAPFSYAWSNGQTTATASGLAAGSICVTITDANGCTASDCDVVVLPTPVVVVSVADDVTCYNGFDGSITVVASGGTAPYTIEWVDGGTDWTAMDLAAGIYCFTVTDANGCTATGCDTVNEPEPLLAYSECPVMILCPGDCTGIIDVTVTGGTPPYSYEWSDGATTEDRAALCAGFYGVTITDAVGCTFDLLHVLENPDTLVVTATPVDVECYGDCNGSIIVSANGGTGDLSIAWANGDSAFAATGLCAGTYCFTVTDANGCTYSDCVTIEQPTPVVAVVTGVDVLCPTGAGAASGSASVAVSGGTGAYTYVWSNGATSASISGLATGNYCVTVTDANGCTASDCNSIEAPAPLTATAVGTDLTCYGVENGSITVTAFGGTAPYSYAWANGTTTATANGLGAGTYQITVTDANGCTTVAEETISEPAPVTVVIDVTNPVCAPGFGSASVTITGGVGDISYEWSNGATTATAGGLVAGSICVTVTDDNGCTASDCDVIVLPTPLEIVIDGNDILCYGASTGSVSVVATGGTTPYSYAWTGGNTTSSASGLTAGTYCVTVTDANGCSATDCVTIAQPTPLTATAVGTDLTCYGVEDGTITVTAAGGTAPYSYAWANGTTTATATGLGAGTYQITVTDANGCTAVAEETITEPTQIVVTTNPTDVTCPGLCTGAASLGISGGSAPYTVAWSDSTLSGGEVVGLCVGTYTFTVTDNNGCTAAGSVTIEAPSELAVDVEIMNVLCADDNTGAATVTVSGGTPAYTIVWSNGGTDFSVDGLVADEYCFTVTDANGCTAPGCVTIAEPTPLLAFSVCPDTLLCPSDCSGIIDVTVSGGTPSYSFLWSDGVTTEDRTGLCAGIYIVTITDANGCEFILAHELAGSTPIVAVATGVNDSNCSNPACDGALNLTVAGGVAPFTYAWSNGATLEDLVNVCGSTTGIVYTVTVTDANDCSAVDTAIVYCVIPPPCNPPINISAPVVCGQTSTTLTIAGVVNPAFASYAWSNGATTSTITVSDEGWYYVTVTINDTVDFLFCESVDSVNVQFLEGVTASTTSNDVTCYNAWNGSINLTISTGTAPFTINWSNGSNDEDLTNLTAGTYCYTVVDANGCSATGCDSVNEPEPLLGYVDCPCPAVLCPGSCTGVVNLTVVGGDGPYTFDWNNGATSEDLAGLCPGFYEVTITDANGCTFDVSHAPFEEADSIVVSTMVIDDADCADGDNEGTVLLVVTGGMAPYEVNWSNGGWGLANGNLAAGVYGYTVMDALGCTYEGSVEVNCGGIILRAETTSNVDAVTISAHPNPFSNASTIDFTLTNDDNVTLEVYSVTGQKVAELFNGSVKANETHSVNLDGGQLADGMYIYRLVTTNGAYTGNMIRSKD